MICCDTWPQVQTVNMNLGYCVCAVLMDVEFKYCVLQNKTKITLIWGEIYVVL